MEGVDLDELVDRLRHVTGFTVPTKTTPPPAPVGKKIDAASALIAQQALRRHPAIVWLPCSPSEVAKGLLEQLRNSCEAPKGVADDSTVMQLLHFLNEAADELEIERLTCVFADPSAAVADRKSRLLGKMGLEETPLLDQNVESYPSPWNVLFTLFSGPLFNCDFGTLAGERHPGNFANAPTGRATSASPFARGDLRVPNATASVGRSIQQIQHNVYDTEAWQNLFNAIGQFPIASVRTIWQAALYVFPTSGTLAVAYLLREIAELSQQSQLAECAEEDDAKAVLKSTVRILNTFYRHLPIALSSDLYNLFFDFVAERVEPDAGSLDALYRVCLRRDVGNAPSSTELWTRYLEWRAQAFTDGMKRRDWVKRLYLRILQIPLLRLDRVKESFENFVALDLRGRFAFEEKVEMEKRFTRAKAEAAEIDQLMSLPVQLSATVRPPWGNNSAYTGQPQRTDPVSQLFLPRPLRTYEDDEAQASTSADRELELWASWQTLLERVERPLLASTGSEALHHSRCRSFFLMRACLFPHQLDSWTDLVHFCLRKQPGQREGENTAPAQQALALAMTFTTSLRLRSTMQLFAAHVQATHFHHPEKASSYLKEGLLECRATLLSVLRAEHNTAVPPGGILQQLEEVLSLAVNWMRLGSDRFHVSMVARFVMHNVELLSLTMAAVKVLLRTGGLVEPSMVLRPFNTFCSEWLTLELVRNRNPVAGLGILLPWKEHLIIMLKSAKGRGWTMASCGVDECFLDSCSRLAKADPVKCPTELLSGFLRELEDAARLSEVVDVAEFAYLARLRRSGWSSRGAEGEPDLANAPFLLGSLAARVVDGGVAPVRYDSAVFSDGTRAAAEGAFVREAVGPDTWRAFQLASEREDADAAVAGGAANRGFAPEESAWPPLGGGGGSHHSAPRQSSFLSQPQSQGRRGGYSQPHGSYPQRRPWEGRGGGGYGRASAYGAHGSSRPFFGAPRPSLGAAPASPAVAKRSRTLLADSRLLPLEESLGSLIARLGGIRKVTEAAVRGIGSRAATKDLPGGSKGKENQRIPELGAAEHLIRELPLVGQYDPECMGLHSISTNWLLDRLCEQEALKYVPEETQP